MTPMRLPLRSLIDRRPAVPRLLLHHDGHQRVARPLAALVGHDPELLAAQHDVVERRGEPGGPHVELARGERGGDGRGGLEVDQLRLHAELLEEALLHAHEDRRRGGELEHADLDLCLGAGLGPRLGCAPAAARDGEAGRERQGQQGESDGDGSMTCAGSSYRGSSDQVCRQGITARSSAPMAQCEATPEQREHHDAHHQPGGLHQVAGLQDQEADAGVGRDQLGRHQQQQRGARAQLEARRRPWAGPRAGSPCG